MEKAHRFIEILVIAAAIIVMAGLSAARSHAVPSAPGVTEKGCRSQTFDTVTLDDLKKTVSGPTGRKNVKSLRSGTEEIPTVIIVVGFSNIDYSGTFDWADKIFEGESSLSQYYKDMSLDQFTFTPVVAETSAFGSGGNTNTKDEENDGIIHVKLSSKHDDWTSPNGNYDHDKTEMETLSAAIAAADEFIDFSKYDTDHDGTIDNSELAVGFVVAGYEAATVSSSSHPELYLWSHAWSFSGAAGLYGNQDTMPGTPTADGVTIDKFIAISELCYNGSSTAQAPISILAHELGHYIGLPDLYDTTYKDKTAPWYGYSPGHLSLMANGSWGRDGSGNYSPYSLDIWSKVTLGWIEPQVIEDPEDGSVATVTGSMISGSGTKALKICTGRDNEYYLAENRRFEDWDATLGNYYYEAGDAGRDGGIILWHIDDDIYAQYRNTNSVNDPDHHPAVTPLYLENYEGSYEPIGESLTDKVVFSSDTYSEPLYLPLYPGDSEYDYPEFRTDLSCLRLTFPDTSKSSMDIGFTYAHNWDSGTVTKRPTANQKGEITYTCENCGATRIEEIDEVPPCTTIRWSSVDGENIISSLDIQITDGMTFEDILGSTAISSHFAKSGYMPLSLRLRPLSDYSGTEEYNSDEPDMDTVIEDGMILYIIMAKELGSAEITLTPPVCGISISTSGSWDSQTNYPRFTTPKGANYKPDDSEYLPGYWCSDESGSAPYNGTFTGGQDYHAKLWLAADLGYCFSNDCEITVNNGVTEKPLCVDNECLFGVIAKVTAVHNWDTGTITKPATARAAGIRTFTCKGCGKTRTESIPTIDPMDQMGTDGTPVGSGASAEVAEKAIMASGSDEGPAGTKFAPLCLKSTKQTKASVKLTWTKVSGAKTYVIYGNKCGKANKMKRLGTTTGTNKTLKKIAGAKIKKGTYYKFIVVALDSDKNVISTSKTVHAGTAGGKAGNPAKVTTKAKKNKVTVKVKKTFKLAARQTGKNIKKHRGLKYETSNAAIATVSSKGVIKGVKKGTCTVYAYAQNGICAKIKVTVK